jgi:hypothetical protein
MKEVKKVKKTDDFKRALDTLLNGYSNECILDAILERIPENDLCRAMLRVFERQNTIMSPTFSGDEIMCALGLGSTLVYGVSSANINVQPSEDFHLDRLIISSDVAKYFLVTDIKVGGESQFQSRCCIPGLSFTENVFAIKLKGDMARPSQFITVSVTNQAANGCNFQGVLIGHIDRKPSPGITGQQREAA